VPILEYIFANVSSLAFDNSINAYAGGINGSVSSVTSSLTLNPSGSGGLLNYYALGLTVGSNGIYTNTSMVEMANAVYINASINVMFPLGSTMTGNCWVIYGNYTAPTQNYIRMFVSSGVVNIQCLSAATVIIAATYSSLSTNTWYMLEFVTASGGNSLIVNGSAVTLTYATGNSTTSFSFSTQMTDKSAIRAYIGGGINGYSAPFCYTSLFSINQSSSTDTTSPYKEQVHELYTNKLVVSGYPYNSNIYDGYVAISNKSGQLSWDNSIQVYPSYVGISANKYLYLQKTITQTGGICRNVLITSAIGVDLSNSTFTAAYFIKFTANTVNVYLPTGSGQTGREYVFVYQGTPGTFIINVAVASSDTIAGGTSYSYSGPTNALFKLIYDGASQWIFM
jgi:hypothetical protein